MNDKEVKKLEKILAMMNDSLTKEDFVESFEKVVSIIEDVRKQNSSEFDAIHETIKNLKAKLEEDNESDIGEAKNQMNLAVCDYCDKMDSKHAKLSALVEDKLAQVKDGKDADESRVLEAVLAQIPPVKELEPETPTGLRDKLESLQDEDRLDKSAIRGLKEEIENLKLMMDGIKTSGGQKGGFKKLKWIAETPTGDIDSVNTEFYLSTTPDPDNLLLVLNGMAQRNSSTYEYVLAGKKITYNSAPPTGSQHFCWFSK